MQKLGKNISGYQGETIDIQSVLGDIERAARRNGWLFEPLPAGNDLALHSWRRSSARPLDSLGAGPARVYISAGIHGDEPAGPLAARQLIDEDRWPADVDVWLCPCLNPSGFPLNQRENAAGIDLNREYLHFEAPETRAHVAWLEQQPSFDVTLCLHEDWESLGFYLYELNPTAHPSHAEEIIRNVSAVCPIDASPVIEDRPASGGIVRPGLDPRSRPRWPEAFWLVTHKTRQCYTLEAPSDFPMSTRVAALVAAVRTVLDRF